MKLESAQIRNFRMLKELNVDFEEVLTLVIGKNNSGKTSFLSILQKFLADSKPEFVFDDFNIASQKEILALENHKKSYETYLEPSLSLKILISYDETDDIGVASALLLGLDNEMRHLVVLFEYALEYEKYLKLISDYDEYKAKGIDRSFEYYIRNNINKYCSIRIKALEHGSEENYKVINNDTIKSIISMQIIGAKRDVDNEQGHSRALSVLASRYYASSVTSEADFPALQKMLSETDKSLSAIYEDIFRPIVKEIAAMSYNPQEAELSIISTLSEKKIFQDNTTVKYKHEDTLLPEDYNGLGYLNLFAIIFNIRIKLDQLLKKSSKDQVPTPLNLLFIEEPEAHTHPQMQYIFIKNIKSVLAQHCKEAGESFSLQTIISTHSSHIVSQCDFEDIKYFFRETSTSVKSRSLKALFSIMVTSEEGISEEKPTREEQVRAYRFIKQYVTLNRAELFFADKAILLEGDTERMLIYAMMKKLDDHIAKNDGKESREPLLSQNISVIEVGAYSHVFATFLGFLEIKTLVITDLDCAMEGENGRLNKCCFTEGATTTNASIKYFTKSHKLSEIISLSSSPIILGFNSCTAEWVFEESGRLRLLFQKEENNYQARSFEDSFICSNLQFIKEHKNAFVSLKNKSVFDESPPDFYRIAENCIDRKTSFALDVLLHGGINNEKWKIPHYIEEGLEWLSQ